MEPGANSIREGKRVVHVPVMQDPVRGLPVLAASYLLKWHRPSACATQGNVLVRVALRVDDGGRACRFVSYQVGSVRQARQIELFENHLGIPSRADCYLG
jgi:hypothetical protein